MAAVKLSKVRLFLIETMNDGILNDLIDGLRNKVPPVLSGREANQILQAHQVTEDKIGLLVDMVSKKGDVASKHLFDNLKAKQPSFFETIPLDQDETDGNVERMEINEANIR